MSAAIKISAEDARAVVDHLQRFGHATDTPCGRALANMERALARHDRYASKSKPSKSSSDCQWCGEGVLSEPCGPSHKMRKRLAEAKKRKAKKPAGTFGLRPGRYRSMKVASEQPTVADAVAALAYPKMVGDRERVLRKESRREETADLWKQAMSRSGGFCECKCGRAFHEEGENKPEMDHEASRRVPQTITNVWMLTLACHRERQRNRPSEIHWLLIFLGHCRRLGYEKEAKRVEGRIAVVEVKTELPSSPRTNP